MTLIDLEIVLLYCLQNQDTIPRIVHSDYLKYWRGIVRHDTWWALAAKPRPSCLHTTMASVMLQFSLQTLPQRLRPPVSINTSTRPSDGTLPPTSRTWTPIRWNWLNCWFSVISSNVVLQCQLSYHVLCASFRDITAYRGILAVFECPWLDFVVVAV